MFYIKRISLLTGENTISSVDLTLGLNIIYGESETGKSLVLDCIDYMFGAKEHRFSTKLDIKEIALILDVDGKSLTMRREIDSNDIEVSGQVEYIENGTYKIGKAKHWINDVWLRLFGIEKEVEILMTLAGRPQHLTLRTFYHLLLIDESRVSEKPSILAQGIGPNKKVATPVLTSLLYLATENCFLPDKAVTDPDIKKAKSEAVKDFYNRSMSALEARRTMELESASKETPAQLQIKIDKIINEIGAAEGELDEATSQSSALAEKILDMDSRIAESRMLMDRNRSLMTQYESDIRRLTFIVEGDINHEDLPRLEVCPFCNGELTKVQGESCISAAVEEVDKIGMQIRDLRSVQEAIEREISELSEERKSVVDERRQVDVRIRAELRPQIERLRSHLTDYTMTLSQYKEKEMLDIFTGVLNDGMSDVQKTDSGDFKFDVKAKFQEVFQEDLDKELKYLLESCKYQNFVGVRFDTDCYDMVVNGSTKRSRGQGYRAFLNTLLATALQNCLAGRTNYQPSLLVIDSPIQSLKERKDHSADISDTMKAGLFQHFVNNQSDRQTIIIENEIPALDYSTVNMIHFTKDENEGRYGLIYGYTE